MHREEGIFVRFPNEVETIWMSRSPKLSKRTSEDLSNLIVSLPRFLFSHLAGRSRVLPFYIWCVYTAAVNLLQQPIWLRFSYRIRSIVDTTTTVREYHLCLILKSRGLPCWKYFIRLGRFPGRIRDFDHDLCSYLARFSPFLRIVQSSIPESTFLFFQLTVVRVLKTVSASSFTDNPIRSTRIFVFVVSV